MKEFQIVRYLKKYKTIIAIISVIMGIAFYVLAQLYFQRYTASTVIQYTNEEAANGFAPDQTVIDPTEMKASNIVSTALNNLDMTGEDVDDIRASLNVEPVVSEEDQALIESKVELGEEYTYNATEYLVTLSSGVFNGKEYPRKILNEILDEYIAYYGKNHVNTTSGINDINDIYSKGYDFIEMTEVIDSSLETVQDYLSGKINSEDSYRAYSTGYSFQDLYDEFTFIKTIKLPSISSQILANAITKDRDVLLKKYRNHNNDLTISNETAEEEIDRIIDIIDSYVEMMSESENTDITSEYILDDVHENYTEDENGNIQGSDQTTEYDRLLEGYVENRSNYESNLIDQAYNEYVISVYEDADRVSSDEELEQTETAIRALVDEVNELYDILYATNDEYNQYLGAQNISVLANVGVSERIPVGLFTVFVVIIFGVLGCVGAILLGRVEDIIEYYAFTNKVDGLPNRAKCDRYIASWEKKALPSQFACAVFKIQNLRQENIKWGRNTGDEMMKTFADILVNVFGAEESNFIAYNGAGQYIVFAEQMPQDHMDACISQFAALVPQRCEDEKYEIQFEYGVALAEVEKCYSIRKLLSIAMVRVGKDTSFKAEDNVEKQNQKPDNRQNSDTLKKKTEEQTTGRQNSESKVEDIKEMREAYYEKFKKYKEESKRNKTK